MTGAADPGGAPDLSLVLKRLMARGYRATEQSRRALANDRTTRAFLEAGLALIADEIGLGADPASASKDEVPRPFLDWLSLTKVAERARQDGPASVAMMRDRWPSRSDFIEDLIAYSLWSSEWAHHAELARVLAAVLSADDNIVEAADRLGYQQLAGFMTERSQRVALLVTAIAGQDDVIQSHRAELRRDAWRTIYRPAGERWGVKLRPDVELGDLLYILAAVNEGLTLRSISDPDAVIDHAARRSLLGKALLMLTAGVFDPGDGLPLSEAARRVCRV
ncbi:MAG: hypothetical protein J2P28_01500 [Actinobacteria bacterium]|nr:hypothetical protein [Actinomycetota bacterium]MBO0834178.1 hypothetical protein [Actinomycetota bacterium]